MKKWWSSLGNFRVQSVLVIVAAVAIILIFNPLNQASATFSGTNAYQLVNDQIEFGPRLPESSAHAVFVDWSIAAFNQAGWAAEAVPATAMEHPIINIVAKKGNKGPLIILGAHYDSRMKADQDKKNSDQPVPGANDGASGVAVLLELARSLKVPADMQVWLVLFDAEDQGNLPGWNWILGSTAFAEGLTVQPTAVVIVDMIGDKDLNIPYEQNSDRMLREEIWKIAGELGYEKAFIPKDGYSMMDDHTPFLKKGITAVDIIDFDYPYWHTTKDTADKVSAESLEMVGRTLEEWIEHYQPVQ